MKKIISISLFLIIAQGCLAQFSDTAALNVYIQDTIKDRRPNKISARQIQKALFGITKFLSSDSGMIKSYTRILTASELANSFSSPITILPSPGVNKARQLVKIYIDIDYSPGVSVNYSNNLSLQVTGGHPGAPYQLTSILGFSAKYFTWFTLPTGNGGNAGGIGSWLNSPLQISNVTGNPADGDYPLKCTFIYYDVQF